MSKYPFHQIIWCLGGFLHTKTRGRFLLFCILYPKSFSNNLFLFYVGIIFGAPYLWARLDLAQSILCLFYLQNH